MNTEQCRLYALLVPSTSPTQTKTVRRLSKRGRRGMGDRSIITIEDVQDLTHSRPPLINRKYLSKRYRGSKNFHTKRKRIVTYNLNGDRIYPGHPDWGKPTNNTFWTRWMQKKRKELFLKEQREMSQQLQKFEGRANLHSVQNALLEEAQNWYRDDQQALRQERTMPYSGSPLVDVFITYLNYRLRSKFSRPPESTPQLSIQENKEIAKVYLEWHQQIEAGQYAYLFGKFFHHKVYSPRNLRRQREYSLAKEFRDTDHLSFHNPPWLLRFFLPSDHIIFLNRWIIIDYARDYADYEPFYLTYGPPWIDRGWNFIPVPAEYDWEDEMRNVVPIMVRFLRHMDIPFEIYPCSILQAVQPEAQFSKEEVDEIREEFEQRVMDWELVKKEANRVFCKTQQGILAAFTNTPDQYADAPVYSDEWQDFCYQHLLGRRFPDEGAVRFIVPQYFEQSLSTKITDELIDFPRQLVKEFLKLIQTSIVALLVGVALRPAISPFSDPVINKIWNALGTGPRVLTSRLLPATSSTKLITTAAQNIPTVVLDSPTTSSWGLNQFLSELSSTARDSKQRTLSFQEFIGQPRIQSLIQPFLHHAALSYHLVEVIKTSDASFPLQLTQARKVLDRSGLGLNVLPAQSDSYFKILSDNLTKYHLKQHPLADMTVKQVVEFCRPGKNHYLVFRNILSPDTQRRFLLPTSVIHQSRKLMDKHRVFFSMFPYMQSSTKGFLQNCELVIHEIHTAQSSLFRKSVSCTSFFARPNIRNLLELPSHKGVQIYVHDLHTQRLLWVPDMSEWTIDQLNRAMESKKYLIHIKDPITDPVDSRFPIIQLHEITRTWTSKMGNIFQQRRKIFKAIGTKEPIKKQIVSTQAFYQTILERIQSDEKLPEFPINCGKTDLVNIMKNAIVTNKKDLAVRKSLAGDVSKYLATRRSGYVSNSYAGVLKAMMRAIWNVSFLRIDYKRYVYFGEIPFRDTKDLFDAHLDYVKDLVTRAWTAFLETIVTHLVTMIPDKKLTPENFQEIVTWLKEKSPVSCPDGLKTTHAYRIHREIHGLPFRLRHSLRTSLRGFGNPKHKVEYASYKTPTDRTPMNVPDNALTEIIVPEIDALFTFDILDHFSPSPRSPLLIPRSYPSSSDPAITWDKTGKSPSAQFDSLQKNKKKTTENDESEEDTSEEVESVLDSLAEEEEADTSKEEVVPLTVKVKSVKNQLIPEFLSNQIRDSMTSFLAKYPAPDLPKEQSWDLQWRHALQTYFTTCAATLYTKYAAGDNIPFSKLHFSRWRTFAVKVKEYHFSITKAITKKGEVVAQLQDIHTQLKKHLTSPWKSYYAELAKKTSLKSKFKEKIAKKSPRHRFPKSLRYKSTALQAAIGELAQNLKRALTKIAMSPTLATADSTTIENYRKLCIEIYACQQKCDRHSKCPLHHKPGDVLEIIPMKLLTDTNSIFGEVLKAIADTLSKIPKEITKIPQDFTEIQRLATVSRAIIATLRKNSSKKQNLLPWHSRLIQIVRAEYRMAIFLRDLGLCSALIDNPTMDFKPAISRSFFNRWRNLFLSPFLSRPNIEESIKFTTIDTKKKRIQDAERVYPFDQSFVDLFTQSSTKTMDALLANRPSVEILRFLTKHLWVEQIDKEGKYARTSDPAAVQTHLNKWFRIYSKKDPKKESPKKEPWIVDEATKNAKECIDAIKQLQAFYSFSVKEDPKSWWETYYPIILLDLKNPKKKKKLPDRDTIKKLHRWPPGMVRKNRFVIYFKYAFGMLPDPTYHERVMKQTMRRPDKVYFYQHTIPDTAKNEYYFVWLCRVDEESEKKKRKETLYGCARLRGSATYGLTCKLASAFAHVKPITENLKMIRYNSASFRLPLGYHLDQINTIITNLKEAFKANPDIGIGPYLQKIRMKDMSYKKFLEKITAIFPPLEECQEKCSDKLTKKKYNELFSKLQSKEFKDKYSNKFMEAIVSGKFKGSNLSKQMGDFSKIFADLLSHLVKSSPTEPIRNLRAAIKRAKLAFVLAILHHYLSNPKGGPLEMSPENTFFGIVPKLITRWRAHAPENNLHSYKLRDTPADAFLGVFYQQIFGRVLLHSGILYPNMNWKSGFSTLQDITTFPTLQLNPNGDLWVTYPWKDLTPRYSRQIASAEHIVGIDLGMRTPLTVGTYSPDYGKKKPKVYDVVGRDPALPIRTKVTPKKLPSLSDLGRLLFKSKVIQRANYMGTLRKARSYRHQAERISTQWTSWHRSASIAAIQKISLSRRRGNANRHAAHECSRGLIHYLSAHFPTTSAKPYLWASQALKTRFQFEDLSRYRAKANEFMAGEKTEWIRAKIPKYTAQKAEQHGIQFLQIPAEYTSKLSAVTHEEEKKGWLMTMNERSDAHPQGEIILLNPVTFIDGGQPVLQSDIFKEVAEIVKETRIKSLPQEYIAPFGIPARFRNTLVDKYLQTKKYATSRFIFVSSQAGNCLQTTDPDGNVFIDDRDINAARNISAYNPFFFTENICSLLANRSRSNAKMNRTQLSKKMLRQMRQVLIMLSNVRRQRANHMIFWNQLPEAKRKKYIQSIFSVRNFTTLIPRSRKKEFKGIPYDKWVDHVEVRCKGLAKRWQDFLLKTDLIPANLDKTKTEIFALITTFWSQFPLETYGTILFDIAWYFLDWDRLLYEGFYWSREERFLRQCDVFREYYTKNLSKVKKSEDKAEKGKTKVQKNKEKKSFEAQVSKFWAAKKKKAQDLVTKEFSDIFPFLPKKKPLPRKKSINPPPSSKPPRKKSEDLIKPG
ncbi:MAG: hypothetical protein ACTSWW_13450 [Promethearchaeota archaeon]